MPSNGERLGQYVLGRRTALDMSQLEVWQAGGPSNTTLSDIENGRLENLTRVTARKLDQGLRWAPGSARTVWDGGEPVPIGRPVAEVEDLDQVTLERLAARIADLEQRIAELAPPSGTAHKGETSEKSGESA